LWQIWQGSLERFDARPQGLAAWTLDVQHTYDPAGKILYEGNGTQRSAESSTLVIGTFAGTGNVGGNGQGDGGPATQASLQGPTRLAAGPDGSLYIVDSGYYRIRKVGPDGIITTVAGNGTGGFSGDGGPATQAQFNIPSDVALGPDGSLYIVDRNNYRVRKVGPDGIITTVAGTGTYWFSGDGGPATQAQLWPVGGAVGPDGSLYIADFSSFTGRIRKVGPDGIITTIVGTGVEGYSGDDGPASAAQLSGPTDLDLGPDGSLYFVDGQRIRKIGPDGIITTV